MVKIRLKRMGSKFNANYKIVAADARAPRDGKFIEALGNYDPQSKAFTLNEEATKKWIEQGAQLTDTVYDLLRKNKLNIKFSKNNKNVSTKKTTKKVESKTETKKVTTKKPSTKKETVAKKNTK